MTDPYKWWKDALAGKKPPVYSEPECGYFLYKSKDGMIPASIYWEIILLDRETGERLCDDELRCEVGGVEADPWETWLFLAKRPIPQAEYEQRLAGLINNGVTDATF